MGKRMGSLQGRNNTLGFGHFPERGKGLIIGSIGVVDSTFILEERVLRPDRSVIESSGNGMRQLDLAVFVREKPGLGSLENAGFPP
jgi:hypothetical protein